MISAMTARRGCSGREGGLVSMEGELGSLVI